jgi:hypothetical protein
VQPRRTRGRPTLGGGDSKGAPVQRQKRGWDGGASVALAHGSSLARGAAARPFLPRDAQSLFVAAVHRAASAAASRLRRRCAAGVDLAIAFGAGWTIGGGIGRAGLARRRSGWALLVGHAAGQRQGDEDSSREQCAGRAAVGESSHLQILTAVLDARVVAPRGAQRVMPKLAACSAIFGSRAVAAVMSACPSAVNPLWSLATPRP